MTALALSRIGKMYRDRPVLRNVSLEVESGEFLVLLGPSGCGKSTLLRIIAGLEMPDRGDVVIDSQRANDLPPSARDIAMVFQSYALYPHKTVFENIALCLEMRRLTATQRLPGAARFLRTVRDVHAGIKKDVTRAAETVGLTALLERKPAELSGGQRQRVALARALVRHPRLFLMDEPLSNLDGKLRAQMREEIVQLHRKSGASCVYVTHDHIEAMTMATRVAVMLDGELLQVATPERIYSDPAHLRVAELIGHPAINVFPGRVTPRGLDVGFLQWPLHLEPGHGDAVQIAFRPEAVRIEAEQSGVREGARLLRRDAERAPVSLPTVYGREVPRVVHIERLGSESHIHVRVPGHDRHLIARVPFDQSFEIDQRVQISVASSAVLVFDTEGKRLYARQRTSNGHSRSAVTDRLA